MANVLGAYNPTFYANEALIWVTKALGLAARVYMGFDEERRTFNKGDTITIRRPATFTAQSAPSAAQAVSTGSVSIALTSHQEVKFEIPDKEFAYTGERIVQDHIMPAAYALADKIDQDLASLIQTVPHSFIEPTAGTATAATIAGILAVGRKQFDQKVPTYDLPNMHYMVGGSEKADLLALAAFSQHQGAGDLGVATQLTGNIGQRYGYNFFANQNRPTWAYADITDTAGTITEPAAKGDTSITVGGLGASEVYNKGTIIKFDVSGYEYAITSTATMTGGAAVVSINPPIRAAEADNAAITIQSGMDNFTTNGNVAFHRNWAALAFAKLPEYEQFKSGMGADIRSIQDPITGLAVRARFFYDGNNSKMLAALDTLYGFKELDGDLACRHEMKNS